MDTDTPRHRLEYRTPTDGHRHPQTGWSAGTPTDSEPPDHRLGGNTQRNAERRTGRQSGKFRDTGAGGKRAPRVSPEKQGEQRHCEAEEPPRFQVGSAWERRDTKRSVSDGVEI